MPRVVITGGRSSLLLGVSVYAAVVTILVNVVAARVLSVADNARFLVSWSVVFAVFQVVSGLQNEATRAVGSLAESPQPGAGGARVLLMPAVLGGATIVLVALGLGIAHAVRGASVLAATAPVVIAVAALIVVSYACHSTLVGTLAGRRAWVMMSAVSASDQTLRVAAVVVVGLVAGSLTAIQLAVLLPGLAWVLLSAVWPRLRAAAGSRADVGLGRLLRNGLMAMVAAGASAVLINGFPALTRSAVGGHLTTAALATLLLTIQLTRAPLMLPLAVFQGVAISAFVAQRQQRLRVLVKALLALVAAGAALALVMAACGPLAMRLLYGYQYVPSRWLIGGLTFAAVSIALLTLSGTAAIAVAAHRAYVIGWWVGAAATVAGLFLLPVTAEWRVVLALFFGPLTGVLYHLVALMRVDALPVDGEALRGAEANPAAL